MEENWGHYPCFCPPALVNYPQFCPPFIVNQPQFRLPYKGAPDCYLDSATKTAEKSTTGYWSSEAENLRSLECNIRKGPTERSMVPKLPSSKHNMTKIPKRGFVGSLEKEIQFEGLIFRTSKAYDQMLVVSQSRYNKHFLGKQWRYVGVSGCNKYQDICLPLRSLFESR